MYDMNYLYTEYHPSRIFCMESWTRGGLKMEVYECLRGSLGRVFQGGRGFLWLRSPIFKGPFWKVLDKERGERKLRKNERLQRTSFLIELEELILGSTFFLFYIFYIHIKTLSSFPLVFNVYFMKPHIVSQRGRCIE